MFRSLRDEYNIRLQIRKLDREQSRVKTDTLSEDEFGALASHYIETGLKLDDKLLGVLTRRLRRQVEYWTVDLPSEPEQPDWYRLVPIGKSGKHTRELFSHVGIPRIRKLIRAERRESIRFYAQIVIPILSLLVALAAILTKP